MRLQALEDIALCPRSGFASLEHGIALQVIPLGIYPACFEHPIVAVDIVWAIQRVDARDRWQEVRSRLALDTESRGCEGDERHHHRRNRAPQERASCDGQGNGK